MNLVAKSKIDGHIYESLPYTENNRAIVEQNIKNDLNNAGISVMDYDTVEMTDEEMLPK